MIGFIIWVIGCIRNCFNCFTALSKCVGWICLFSKSICIHSDYIIEPFIVLGYDCFSCCDRIYKIDTDKIRYAKI